MEHQLSGFVAELFTDMVVLMPEAEEIPQYSQLYIIEAAQALNLRMQNPVNTECDRATIALIQDVLDHVNPFVASYKHMK